jgi:hypothetical protein
VSKARILGVHLATSRAILPSTLIAIAGAVIAFLSQPLDTVWVGRPQNTALYLTVFGFAIAGCLSLVAGFVAGSDLAHDRGSLARRSAHPLSRLLRWRVLADLAWLGVGLVIAAAFALIRTAGFGGVVRADTWSPAVLSAASVVATYGWGLLLGAVLRHPGWLILVGPIPYALTLYASGVVAMSDRPAVQQLVAPFIDQSWYPSLVPNPGPILTLATYVLLTGAMAGISAGALLARLHHGVRTGGAALAVCALATVLVAAHVASTWSPDGYARLNTSGVRCSPSHDVCVWSDQASQLPTWQEASQAVERTTDLLPLPHVRFTQKGIRPSESGSREVDVFNPRPSQPELTAAMLAVYAVAATEQCGAGEDAESARSALLQDLTRHLSNGVPLPANVYERIMHEYCP